MTLEDYIVQFKTQREAQEAFEREFTEAEKKGRNQAYFIAFGCLIGVAAFWGLTMVLF